MSGEDQTLAADSSCSAPGSDAAPASLIPGARLGRYVVLDQLGMGGMGVVYAAYDPQLDRKVAIKLVRPSTGEIGSARLLREAKAMAKLSHPNVVTVHDVGIVDEQVFVAMEFVDGCSLKDWLGASPRPWPEILATVLDAGRGLAAAHEHGLVHRDFKPDNVMIGKDGRVQVLDFGLVRAGPREGPGPPTSTVVDMAAEHRAEVGELTRAGSLLGTPAYMAPEQMSGLDADARSDQFSFCVTLYEALYGERPFFGETIAELVAVTMAGRLAEEPRSSAVPRWVRARLLRGLAVAPDERFASMDELLEVLSQDPSRRRRVWVTIAAALAVLVAVIFIGLAISRRHTAGLVAQCQAAGARIDEVWNDDARDSLAQAFERTGSPYASTSHERMIAWLDPWAARWAEERASVCTRAHVANTLAPATYERASSCFDEQRERLVAMLEVFAEPDVDMVAGAAKAAASFSQLESCADERLLLQRPMIPERLESSPERGQVRRRLARVFALLDAGDYARGLALAREAVSLAVTLRWPPLEAEARLAAASIHSELGDYAEVIEELRTAYKLASASGSDLLAAKAAIMLLRVLGYHLARAAEGRHWADVAEALLLRLDRTEGIDAAQLANNVALVHEVVGDYSESEAWHHRALTLRQQVLSADHPETAHSYANLGNIALLRKQLDTALRWHLRALEVRSQGLGPGHPDVARSYSNTGRVYLARGDLDEALSYFHSSYDILARTVGEHHRVAARVLGDIGKVHLARGESQVALDHFRRAAKAQHALLGPHHHETAQSTFDIGRALLAEGEHAQAYRSIQEASTAFSVGLPDDHPFLQQVHDAMGSLCAAGHAPACGGEGGGRGQGAGD